MAELSFEKQNDDVMSWAQRAVGLLKGNSNALGIQHRSNSPSHGSSVNKIKDHYRRHSGTIDMVGFRFPRSLIWPHKGAGKGMGGNKGSVWYDSLGIKHTTNPKSLGKAGTGNRKIKPWFNEVMDGPKGVDELATIVAEDSGDIIVNNILIK